MPLVEVIRGERTSEQTVATTVNLAESIGKNPVVVNDCPGFLVNRILFPYLNAFVALIRDGADFQSVDKVMERFGWPMGPGYLIDVIGIDTVYHANEVLAKGYPDRMKHDYPSALEVLNEHDRLGQKTGSGFYKYKTDEKGKPRKFVDEEIYELIKPIQSDSSEFNDEEIIQRMMVPMCLEAARCIEDRIVESPATVDMGLIWGLGFPPFRGGPLRYIDSIGAEAFCTIADRYAHLGKAYHATEGLRENASRGKTFF
jgi:3-hydroxyacyl-CoA dehydrogenase/enoyl-CoA hydratase/3-hydroxybutyryl-CoA epimerase/enoyl-CoA isomerase